MYDSVKSGISNIYQAFKNWLSDMWNNVFGKFFDWINSAINKLRDFFGLNSKAQNTDISYATTDGSTGTVTMGHALGGVFNREHIARFAEGNKAEAIIPLENETAMKPFVDAVSNGVSSALMPLIANISVGQQSQLQPLYVGTLIADERGLKELSRKLDIIQLEEKARRG
jgi:SLT domain-containing protein